MKKTHLILDAAILIVLILLMIVTMVFGPDLMGI